jgi:hypothetical protein
VDAGVLPDVYPRYRRCRQRPSTGLNVFARAGQGEHRAVVIRVGVNIEQTGARRFRQRGYDLFVLSLAQIHDALEETRFGPGHEP